MVKVSNIAAAALIAGGVLVALGAPVNAESAEDKKVMCTIEAVGTQNTANHRHSKFTVNGKTATAKVKVSGHKSCRQDATLAVWKASNPFDGRPFDQQKLHKYTTKTNLGVGEHQLSVQLPDCYFQLDLVKGANPTGPNGGPDYLKEGRMLGNLHGGEQKCDEVPAVPPVTEGVKGETAPEALPKTGISSALVGSGVLGSMAAGFQYFRQSRKLNG